MTVRANAFAGGDAGADTGYIGPAAAGDAGANTGYIGPIGNSSTKKTIIIEKGAIQPVYHVANESQIDYANNNLVTQITLALNKDNNAAGN